MWAGTPARQSEKTMFPWPKTDDPLEWLITILTAFVRRLSRVRIHISTKSIMIVACSIMLAALTLPWLLSLFQHLLSMQGAGQR